MRRTVTGVDLGRDSIKAVEVEIDGAAAQILRSVSIPRVRLEGQEPESVAAALAEGNLDKAADSITVEMQDQVAVVGTSAECRVALEKRRGAGLQMPVIAPFAVGDNMASHMHVINALAPKG